MEPVPPQQVQVYLVDEIVIIVPPNALHLALASVLLLAIGQTSRTALTQAIGGGGGGGGGEGLQERGSKCQFV